MVDRIMRLQYIILAFKLSPLCFDRFQITLYLSHQFRIREQIFLALASRIGCYIFFSLSSENCLS